MYTCRNVCAQIMFEEHVCICMYMYMYVPVISYLAQKTEIDFYVYVSVICGRDSYRRGDISSPPLCKGVCLMYVYIFPIVCPSSSQTPEEMFSIAISNVYEMCKIKESRPSPLAENPV